MIVDWLLTFETFATTVEIHLLGWPSLCGLTGLPRSSTVANLMIWMLKSGPHDLLSAVVWLCNVCQAVMILVFGPWCWLCLEKFWKFWKVGLHWRRWVTGAKPLGMTSGYSPSCALLPCPSWCDIDWLPYYFTMTEWDSESMSQNKWILPVRHLVTVMCKESMIKPPAYF